LLALAIGTDPFKYGVFTDVSAAAPAVIGHGAGKKLLPAAFAQILVGFTNAFFAVDTNRRPEKMI
jgi:hypothetical protein